MSIFTLAESSLKRAGLAAIVSLPALAYSEASLATTIFDTGIPAAWTCTGTCGTSGSNGVVTLAPGGGSQYGWVSTVSGPTMKGLNLGAETNGSTLVSSKFAATAGQNLQFSFNYITSDGAGYADYGWAQLLDASMNGVALLFTARTTPNGNSVPGFGMPAIAATIVPPTVTIVPGGPAFSPLGNFSGQCYNVGCGYSGWVQSNYTIASSGDYFLKFGVVNWLDQAFDSALAFDGITIGGTQIGEGGTTVPEPGTLGLIGFGLAVVGLRRQAQTDFRSKDKPAVAPTMAAPTETGSHSLPKNNRGA